jgi:hypothetical protein
MIKNRSVKGKERRLQTSNFLTGNGGSGACHRHLLPLSASSPSIQMVNEGFDFSFCFSFILAVFS